MQYLTLNTLFFAEIIISVLAMFAVTIRYKLHAYTKQQTAQTLNTLQKKELPFFYSSYTSKQECRQTFFHQNIDPLTKLESQAIKNLKKTAPKVRSALKKSPQNLRLKLLDAEISWLLNRRHDFATLIEQITLPHFAPAFLKAKYFYLSALNELYQTDMASASAHLSKALKIYKKQDCLYEEAECYGALGQIYRIAGVFDVARTMYREAKKIYDSLKLYAKSAEAEAYLGLTEIGRENYPVALEYLDSAAALAQNCYLIKTQADINNWQGLTTFLTRKFKPAATYYKSALKNGTPAAAAFAAEMLARIMFKTNRSALALKYADTALELNKTQNNPAGIFETLYLKAQIYYQEEDLKPAKKILTALIKEKTPPSTLYYPANAYTLLGLIELKEKNLNKAKTLFKQALDLEHAKNRLKGAAIDYQNLAKIALLENDTTTAKTYLDQALLYAKTIGDEELIIAIKQKN